VGVSGFVPGNINFANLSSNIPFEMTNNNSGELPHFSDTIKEELDARSMKYKVLK